MKSDLRLSLAFITGISLILSTAMAAEDLKTVSLFNGRGLSGWQTLGGKGTNQWTVGKAALDAANPEKLKIEGPGTDLISLEPGANLATEASFGDCIVDVEFMMARHSNSGVKMMNIYEVQIFDSFGKTNVTYQDCGAVYMESAPRVNACKGPGEWQRLVIEFRAPRFDESGEKTANATFIKVTLNGQDIQENVQVAHGTNVSRNAKEHPRASLFLQGDHGPVAFRNLKVTPLN